MGGKNLKKLSEMTPINSGLETELGLKNKPVVHLGGGTSLRALSRKSFLLIVLILLVSLFPLNAADTIEWLWNSQDERVSYYRYQLNGEAEGKWTVVDSSVTSISLPLEDSTLYVQASYDGVNWSESHSKTYIKEKFERRFSVRVSVTPYSSAFFHFYNGYNTNSTRTKTQSVYGFAFNAEVNVPLLSWMSIYPEFGYDLIVKEDTIIPGARLVQYYKLGAGLDFTFDNSIYIGLFGGVMAHINNKKASITPYFGARLGYDYKLGEHLSVGAVSRVSFALFLGRSNNLMDSMTILLDPLGVTLTYRF